MNKGKVREIARSIADSGVLFDQEYEPEPVMSVEEWEQQYGSLTDEDIAQALAAEQAAKDAAETAALEAMIAADAAKEEVVEAEQADARIVWKDVAPDSPPEEKAEPKRESPLTRATRTGELLYLHYRDGNGRFTRRLVIPCAVTQRYFVALDVAELQAADNVGMGKSRALATAKRSFRRDRIQNALILEGEVLRLKGEGVLLAPATDKLAPHRDVIRVMDAKNAESLVASGNFVPVAAGM